MLDPLPMNYIVVHAVQHMGNFNWGPVNNAVSTATSITFFLISDIMLTLLASVELLPFNEQLHANIIKTPGFKLNDFICLFDLLIVFFCYGRYVVNRTLVLVALFGRL